jgi:hypothetical protein
MLQVPAVSAEIIPLLLVTEQTPGVVVPNTTGSPELALAETLAVPPNVKTGADAKLMLCGYALISAPPRPQLASNAPASTKTPSLISLQLIDLIDIYFILKM